MARKSLSPRRRRIIVCRILACTVTATVFGTLLFPSYFFSRPHVSAKSLFTRGNGAVPLSVKEINMRPKDSSLSPQIPIMDDLSIDPMFFGQSDALARDIYRLESFMSDEIHVKTIFAPFLDSDEKHVRDIGLRTKLFEEAFDLWESVHAGPLEGSLHPQNVISRLRIVQQPSFDAGNAINVYDRFRSLIHRFSAHLFPWTLKYHPDHMSFHASLYQGGRGIVMTAGNAQAKYLMTTIPALREIGCKLPIEVLYLGDGDLSEANRDKLNMLPGVTTRDLTDMVDDRGWKLAGWAAKPFAILMSSFREVVLIDADALFFQKPEVLFEDPQYLDTGALFFADRLFQTGNKREWISSILPRPFSRRVKQNRMWSGESIHMQDSGVVVVDKWKHFVPLLLTTRLNGPDRDSNKEKGKKGVYDMVYGDKETFWLSWEMTGNHDYAFYNGSVGNMGIFKEQTETPEGETTENKPASEGSSEDSHDSEAEKEGTNEKTNGLKQRSEVLTTARDIQAEEEKEICSPQLLHIDRGGNPLWFNGWLATDKFVDNQKYANFEVFMKEPSIAARPGTKEAWDLHGHNVVCLRGLRYGKLNEEEKRFLDMVIDLASQHDQKPGE